jgi:hypothetical protein
VATTLSPAQIQRNVLATHVRHKHSADKVAAARRDLAAVTLEEYIRKTVAAAAPFTPAQRDTILAAFAGFTTGGGK